MLGQAAGLPCSILNTPAEFVEDEQLAARDYFVTLPGADGRDVRMPGAPFRSSPELFTRRARRRRASVSTTPRPPTLLRPWDAAAARPPTDVAPSTNSASSPSGRSSPGTRPGSCSPSSGPTW